MFQFVIGSSGAGKTRFVYDSIIDASIEHPEKQFFVLVPEQASLEAQKNLVRLHPKKGIMNIDALSFMRLSHRIFAETGRDPKVALDDAGKTLVVKRVLKEHAGELVYFAANAGRRGFCIEMKSVISELMQYGIDSERLSAMQELLATAPKSRQLLQKKLHDVAVCYEGFKKYISDRFIAPEEVYDLLADAVYESKILKGATIALDGYTGFTPSQYRLLSALLSTCEKVYITITMDPLEAGKKPDKHDLFYLSFKTMENLRRIAADAGCEEEPAVFLPKDKVNPRFQGSPAMAGFEKRLFINSRMSGARAKEDAVPAACPVVIKSARNPVAEVKALCCEINASLHEGLRYRDMAVITGAMDQYAPVLSREFEKAGIPAFLDFRRGIMSNPVVELLRAVTDVALYGADYGTMTRLLSCRLFKIDDFAKDALDNYIFATGIRGSGAWGKEWTKTWKRPHTPDLKTVNAARENVFTRVFTYTGILEGKTTVSAKIEALRAFLVSEEVEQRLDELCGDLESFAGEYSAICAKDPLLISEYAQILGRVEEIFARMQGLIGDEIIPLKDFAELLDLGFEETKVGLLPQSMDCMLVGDVERSRFGDIKKLFFIGVNEGVIPAAASGSGIISDSDRAFFAENGFELSPTLREKAYTEEFYLYQNLTKPSESLCVSFSENDPKDGKLMPSYLVGLLKRMYEGLEVRHTAGETAPEYRLLADNGRTRLTEILRDYRADALENGAWSDTLKREAALLSGAVHVSESERESLLSSVFYKSREQQIEADTAKRLYGDFFSSISRLEEFAGCNLRHFLDYGLGLSDRKEYKIHSFDIGNLCHNIVELCGKQVIEEKRDFRTLTPEDCRELVDSAAKKVLSEYENGMMTDSSRNVHIFDLVRSACLRTMLTTVHQLEGGSFVPAWLEESFSIEKGDLKLTGRFDRIDVCEDGGKLYIKVVDYKSSEHKVDDGMLEAGLQLQLGIYAAAAEALVKAGYPDKEFVPGAIFYYHINDPIVDDTEDPEAAINKELRPSGRVNGEPEVVIRLDNEFTPEEGTNTELKPGVTTDRIPVATTKEGKYSSYSAVWTRERFEEITALLTEKAQQYVKDIKSGAASANPARYKATRACTFCDFKDMCAFGPLSGKRERIIAKGPQDDDE
ncbi:MAG: PD-(D/E)XK nuclease family protein [Lachnospiraceae bacterium]|nr:PD-(D/E)XK nuclease family protein [Lachnospiraceae bacterium]